MRSRAEPPSFVRRRVTFSDDTPTHGSGARGPRRPRQQKRQEKRLPAPDDEAKRRASSPGMPADEAWAADGGDGKPLTLRSAEGDLFEVDALLLCRHSPMVHSLVEDAGLDEEIPVPMVGSRILGVLLDHLRLLRRPGAWSGGLKRAVRLPDGAEPAMLLDLIWAAKLLGTEQLQTMYVRAVASHLKFQARDGLTGVYVRAATGHIEGGASDEPPFRAVPWAVLIELLQDDGSASHLSESTICLLLDLVRSEDAGLVITAVRRYLDSKNDRVRDAAASAMVAIGTADAVLPLLWHQTFTIRMRGCKAVPCGQQWAMDVAWKLLKHDSWQDRVCGIDVLARAYPCGEPVVVEALISCLGDKVRDVRDAAARRLADYAPKDDAEIAAAVQQYVEHKDWPVRCSALRALRALMPGRQDLVIDMARRLDENAGGLTMAKNTARCILRGICPDPAADGPQEADERLPGPQRARIAAESWADESSGQEDSG